jgi:hypothetical protein
MSSVIDHFRDEEDMIKPLTKPVNAYLQGIANLLNGMPIGRRLYHSFILEALRQELPENFIWVPCVKVPFKFPLSPWGMEMVNRNIQARLNMFPRTFNQGYPQGIVMRRTHKWINYPYTLVP